MNGKIHQECLRYITKPVLQLFCSHDYIRQQLQRGWLYHQERNSSNCPLNWLYSFLTQLEYVCGMNFKSTSSPVYSISGPYINQLNRGAQGSSCPDLKRLNTLISYSFVAGARLELATLGYEPSGIPSSTSPCNISSNT